jgi:hypothetical protein
MTAEQRPPTPTFYWFPAEQTRTITRRLARAGPDAQLQFRLVDGKAEARVSVPADQRSVFVAAEGEDCDEWINNAHACPPRCP